jgi:hypothetical protein
MVYAADRHMGSAMAGLEEVTAGLSSDLILARRENDNSTIE